MKEKKQSANWYIAATHYLTAGFVIPFLVSLIAGIIAVPFVAIINPGATKNSLIVLIVVTALMLVALYLGVIYSSRYLAKTYIIKDSAKIVKLSVIYMIVIFVIFRIDALGEDGLTNGNIINIVHNIIAVAIFYTTSKKYVKNSE